MLPSRTSVHKGFSILEVVVVAAVLATVAAGSLFVASSMLNGAVRDSALSRIIEVDRYARNHSKRSSVELQVDLIAGTFAIDGQVQLRLPESVRIVDALSTSGQAGSTKVALMYHDMQCATYAYRVALAREGHVWLVISGSSGEHQRLKSNDSTDAQVKNWFARWRHSD